MPSSQADLLPRLVYETTPELPAIDHAAREKILAMPNAKSAHDESLARNIALFDRLEVGGSPNQGEPLNGPVTIALWNVERGRHPHGQAALLGQQNAAACLLCELDLGMARTGQRHTTRDLAERLGAGYAYGVEYLELGLGDEQEQDAHANEQNRVGLHGGAILSRYSLERPALVRLDTDGRWFDDQRGQRRVGGRIAVLASLRIDDQPVTLASVHLESHGNPEGRAAATAILLDAIDQYAKEQPVLIGGDFNTSTVARDWSGAVYRGPALSAERAINPIPHEPLFDVLRKQGYGWQKAND
ncbi:MAG: endonuclease/exonuclease/phosphatase family protein, partial [Alphaproteobacteria bacterium]|nr:endonuclease/exonuclease/phosphatase family protein [Alphaproteobacteria bacterium]